MRRLLGLVLSLGLLIGVPVWAGGISGSMTPQSGGGLGGRFDGGISSIPVPPWVLSGATVDADFANNRIYGCATFATCITTSRAQTVPSYAETVAGALTSFAADTPRITDKGLLIEEARTNLALQSQTFDNASWTKTLGGIGSAPVVTANTDIAPDGTTTADRVVFALGGGTTTTDQSILRQSVTVVAATVYTHSVYAKSKTGASYAMLIQDGAGVQAAITVTPVWQRFQISWTSPGTTSFCGILLKGGSTPVNSDSADIAVWGDQIEAGAFPTSYIPTTTAAVTRAADSVNAAGALLAAGTGAAYSSRSLATPQSPAAYAANQVLFTSDDGTASNRLTLRRQNTSSNPHIVLVTGGSVTINADVSAGAVAWATNSQKRFAIAAAAGSQQAAFDGVLDTSSYTLAMPVANTLRVGSGVAGEFFNGYIARQTWWNSRISNGAVVQ